MGGKRMEIGIILASFLLYLDIITIFLECIKDCDKKKVKKSDIYISKLL